MIVTKERKRNMRQLISLLLVLCLLVGQVPVGAVTNTQQEVAVTGISTGAFRLAHNDWYIILQMDQPDFALTSVAGLQAPVDDTTKQVWFQVNSQLSVPAGCVALTLAATKDEHTVTLPAGTTLGQYTLKEDFVFHTHADGTLEAAKLVSVTGVSAYNFRGNDWYIILDTDVSDFALTAIQGMQMPVDSGTVQAWFQINSQLSVAAGKFSFTLATTKAEHTVTLPAGTALGEYILKTDFVLYTHANGTITYEAPQQETTQPQTTEAAEKVLQITGIKAYNFRGNDWYIILNTDVSDFALTAIQGMQMPVDSGTVQAWFQINSQLSVPAGSFSFTLATNKAEHTVTLPAGTVLGEYTLARDFVFYTHANGTITFDAPQPETTEPETTEPETTEPETTEPETTEPAAEYVNITGISAYNFRGNDWYIILNTDVSDFALTAIQGMQMPVDSGTVQAWFQINSQLSVPAGSFAFTLATTKAEHTVTLPAGTVLGEYTLARDFVFNTHSNGSLTAEPSQEETTEPETTEPETTEPETTEPATEYVNITGVRAYNFRGNDWYIILNTDISDFALTAIQGMQMPVDNSTAQAWFQINSQLSVPAGSFAFTLATNKAEHTVTLPAGTDLGGYVLENDFVFYTHSNGSLTAEPSQEETTEPETTEPETTEPETTDVTITDVALGTYRPAHTDWYIILQTDVPGLTLTGISGLQLPVDDTQVQAWLQINSQLDIQAGCVGMTMPAELGEHTVTVPAGTALGQYTLKEDFVFYLHGNGVANTDAPIKPVEFRFASAAYREQFQDYIVYMTVDTEDAIAVNNGTGVQGILDGENAQLWAYPAEEQQVFFVVSTTKAKHTLELKAGTAVGPYIVKEDVTVYLYPDGTGGTEPLPAPIDFQFDRGQWQYIPENGLARYLVWLDAQLPNAQIPWAAYSCLTVDGEDRAAYAMVDNGQILLVLDAYTGFTKPGEHTIVLKKGAYIGNYEIKKDVTLYTHGLTVDQTAPVTIPEHSETVSVINDSRNMVGQTPTGLYFGVEPADALPFDGEKGTIRYGAASGGVYFNGENTGATLTKWLENLYYIPLAEFGYTPEKGDVVTVDGVFGNAEHAVKFEKQSFVYDGNGSWELGTFLRDLREQPYTVQDISELKMGVSEIALEPGVQLVGEAEKSTNIAIRTIVTTNLDATEFNFGFSKLEGMWDKAGWQVWMRPKHNQVYLAHGEVDWQITGHYEFTQEEFIVEFGTVDMHEFVNGVDRGLYCRKIFLKINGEEVISYKDTDLSRNVGKKLYVLNSQDLPEGKLTSLTSQGVTMRELTPTVYDYFDLTGVAADTVAGGKTVLLGQTQSSSNVAVRLQLDIADNATEMRLALSKQDPGMFWDEPGTGWQFWLRPRWDTAYIAHGTNDHETIQPFPYSGKITLEVGVRDVVIEKNGVQIGKYCRRLYILVNGQEIASWEDMDFNRPIGNCVMLLTSQDTQVGLSTLKKTQTLPVETVVNGAGVESSEFVDINAQVIPGEPSKIAVIYRSDYNNMTTLNGLYLNDQLLEPVQEENGKAVYLLENPAENDRLRVDLTVKELTADEPTRIFDLFDTSGKAMVEVPGKTNSLTLGAMVDRDGQAAVNSAVRFRLQLPSQFNQVPIGILGDVGTLWSNSGALFQITPNQINFCNPSTVTRLASFYCGLFAPGNSVCVELGVVKCYENGVYRYDRWYVKAGQTQEEMEIVAWYDSVERGRYGGHFCCNGTDLDESYFLYSLKDIYTVTDISAQEDRQLLRTYQRLAETLPELYYPEALEGYAAAAAAAAPGYIRFFTQPGTKLQAFTVNGVDVLEKVTVGVDGAYCYAMESLTEDIRFAYEIAQDATEHTVTVEADPSLQVTVDKTAVLTGDDLFVSITAEKGFVPQLAVDGADFSQLLSFADGLWSCTLRSIRQDTLITVTAVERSYTVTVTENEGCTVTLGGDAVQGQLPFGGTLELTVAVKDGYSIQYVLVGSQKLHPDANGVIRLEGVYMDLEQIVIEAAVRQAEVQNQPAQGQLSLWWIAVPVAALAALTAGLLLGKKKKKEGDAQ